MDVNINRENRLLWDFQYTGQQLLDACNKIVDYCKERIGFWEAEHNLAVKNLETATVTIHRQQVTGGEQVSAIVDPTLAQRVKKCEDRIKHYQDRQKEYEIWSRAFENQMGTGYRLKPDDIQYFEL